MSLAVIKIPAILKDRIPGLQDLAERKELTVDYGGTPESNGLNSVSHGGASYWQIVSTMLLTRTALIMTAIKKGYRLPADQAKALFNADNLPTKSFLATSPLVVGTDPLGRAFLGFKTRVGLTNPIQCTSYLFMDKNEEQMIRHIGSGDAGVYSLTNTLLFGYDTKQVTYPSMLRKLHALLEGGETKASMAMTVDGQLYTLQAPITLGG